MNERALVRCGRLLLLLAVLLGAGMARAQDDGVAIEWWLFGGGGGLPDSGEVAILDVLGQPVAGSASSDGLAIESGFLEQSVIPTAVTLVRFTAARVAGGILLQWETASEIDNLGYDLYRAGGPGDGPRLLNQDLIPAADPGGLAGALYSYLDATASPDLVYDYWLEALAVGGGVTSYGPLAVAAGPQGAFLPLVLK